MAIRIFILNALTRLSLLSLATISDTGVANLNTRRLYHEKLNVDYNKLIRPTGNISDLLTVKVGLRLTAIIDIDEKNQIMTSGVWLEQEWYDYKLAWNPAHYGNVTKLYVPSTEIWLPDIVLYNSADGNFTVKIMTKATVHHTGLIEWNPPVIYKSLCLIDVEYFPFDVQVCTLKIGSWSYDGHSVDIKHNQLEDHENDLQIVEKGINLSDYASSTEWDLLAVPAQKYVKYYPCCSEPYPDIKFNITIRRKTLYHTVNLILPCITICGLTLLVFFVPAYSGEKITMAITILNSLNIFLLLVAEINPPTSLATPLIGKYLLFTMVLVTCSIIVTVFVLNVHFRSPSTHVMSPFVKHLFLQVLPRLLFMQRPQDKIAEKLRKKKFSREAQPLKEITPSLFSRESSLNRPTARLPLPVKQAVDGVAFIAEHLKDQDQSNKIKEDWQFVAMVMDRLFMWMLTAVSLVGTLGIISQAPTLYDTRVPLG